MEADAGKQLTPLVTLTLALALAPTLTLTLALTLTLSPAHHGLTAYVSAHRLAHACLRWAGPPPSRAGQAQSPPLRAGQAQDGAKDGAQRGAQRGVPAAWGAWETGSACSEPVE